MEIDRRHVKSDNVRLLIIFLQTYLLLCVHVESISAQQYDYETSGQQQQGSNIRRTIAGLLPLGISTNDQQGQGAIQQNRWDQAMLNKCMQLQRMAVQKRNFGLEIPDIIMNRVQGGTEGNPALKDLRVRMMQSGKRK